MTAKDIDREIQNLSTGRMMRCTSYSGFKLVVVLGAARDGRRVRICPWSDNKRAFSGPQTREPHLLVPIDLDALSSRQRKSVQHAMEDIDTLGRVVRWKNGQENIRVKPWLYKTSTARVPAEGVTKLPSVIAKGTPQPIVVTPSSKTKLQKLNESLSAFMFGGKRR